MRKDVFLLLRMLFNNLDLDLQPQNKLDEQGLDALKKTRELFNMEFETLTVEDFEELIVSFEDYQNNYQLFGDIFKPEKLN